MKKIIETQRAPGAIGPYVQGVDLGSMVFTSGQIPVCPQTGEIPAHVQENITKALTAGNLDAYIQHLIDNGAPDHIVEHARNTKEN